MRAALAYAGTLAESAAIRRLADRRGAEVLAMTVDFGLGRLLEGIRDRAPAPGARRAHVVDGRERCAERLVQVGVIEQVAPIAHAGSSSSLVDRLLRALGPAMSVPAVADAWTSDAPDLEAFRVACGLAPVQSALHERATGTVDPALEEGTHRTLGVQLAAALSSTGIQ